MSHQTKQNKILHTSFLVAGDCFSAMVEKVSKVYAETCFPEKTICSNLCKILQNSHQTTFNKSQMHQAEMLKYIGNANHVPKVNPTNLECCLRRRANAVWKHPTVKNVRGSGPKTYSGNNRKS